MSSSSQIAVAQVYSPPAGSPALLELSSGEPLAAEHPDDSAWQHLADAEPANSDGYALSQVWDDVIQGRMRVRYQTTAHNVIRLVAQVDCRHDPLCQAEAAVLLRVLCGDPQKVLASDLGIANSTVSGRFVGALIKLGLAPRQVPLAVVLAAQSAAGLIRLRRATSTSFENGSGLCTALQVPRPTTSYLGGLTRAEQQVAQALIEGCTRSEIALRRTTSMFTVTRQFSSIFSALRVTGRYALIRCAAERDCFS